MNKTSFFECVASFSPRASSVKRPAFRRRRRNSGSAILIVLWAVAVLTLLVFGVVEVVDSDLDEETARNGNFQARQLAESGLAVGLHPLVKPGDSLLRQTPHPGETFEVKLGSEEGRLQINALLAGNQGAILLRLFEQWGLKSDEAHVAVDSLLDWVNPGDLAHLNGAKRDYYTAQGHPEYPRNAPFQSVDEMALVRGMDAVAQKKPEWEDFFTIWGDGKLDVNEASSDLIQAVCGATPDQAEAVIQWRNGLGGHEEKKEALRFTDLNQFRSVLGVSEEDFQGLVNLLTLDGPVKRIESTGKDGRYRKTIVLVFRRDVVPMQYLAWLEP